MIEELKPFAPLIYKTNIPFDFQSVREKVVKHLAETKESVNLEQGDAKSSVLNRSKDPHVWEEFRPLFQRMNPMVTEAMKGWKFSMPNLGIGSSWFNVHNRGGWTDEHQHRGTAMACVIYLSVPEGSGNLQVRDPLEYHWSSFSTIHETAWTTIPVKTGDVLLLPPWLYHRTEKNETDEPRYILSLNFVQM